MAAGVMRARSPTRCRTVVISVTRLASCARTNQVLCICDKKHNFVVNPRLAHTAPLQNATQLLEHDLGNRQSV